MTKITLSSKYEIVIPKELRESMGLKPRMKLEFVKYSNTLSLIPLKPMKEMRGFLKGMDPTFKREKM